MFDRLLLAMDDTPAGQVGLSYAAAMARHRSSSVHVLYVNQLLVGGRGQTVRSPGQARQLIDEALEDLQAHQVPATGEVVIATCFDLPRRIAEVAAAWSADAIVVGSRRHRRLSRWRGDAVRERVISLSPLPVLTAPAPLRVGRIQPPTAPGPDAQPISYRT